MKFRVLGPVELAADRRRVVLSSDRQRVVLAALLAHPDETVSTGRLVDALWGANPPATAVRSLHSHVSRLRRVLAALPGNGPDPLVTDPGGYRVALGAPDDLDAARFEALLRQSRSSRDPRTAVELLDEALGLWRGAAFGGVTANEVVGPAASRLEQLRAAAAADRVDAVLALGGHPQVLGELEAAVADSPLAERPHAQLMLALYRSGRQVDALATFRVLRHRLQEEAGLDPGPELRRLHEQILRQDPSLAPDLRRTTTGTTDLSRTTSTTSTTGTTGTTGTTAAEPAGGTSAAGDLIGREDDAAAVAALVRTAPLVTLTGPGGVGKTRLAGEVAARAGAGFPDGTGTCRLAAVTDPVDLAAAMVGALRIPHTGNRSAREILLAALGTRRFLLVLDNCEHLLDSVAGLVDEVRRHCPHVCVLATSREHLHLPGEQVWEVAPLPAPPAAANVAQVTSSPAGALFCARAQAGNPRFQLTSGNAPVVADLCRRLDGIPLAIELAAARTRALTLADLTDRLEHRFHLLTAGPRGDGGRHRTLQAAVEWSYGLLTTTEAQLFDRLSVFPDSFSLAAAEQVCAGGGLPSQELAGVLAELVDKSMVSVVPAGDRLRYRLLETMRAYGTERLTLSGAADHYRHAHARHYVTLVERLAPAIRGADDRTAVATIDTELAHLRAAHAWLIDTGDVDLALRLPVALHDYLHYRLHDEMVTWTSRALELPGAREHPAYPAALATAARGAMHRGDLARAGDAADATLTHAAPDSLPALWALHVRTEVALYQGRLPEALDFAARRAALAGRLGHDYYRALAGVSAVLGNLYGGAPAAALAHAAEARRAADACGNTCARAWVLYAHGEALLDTDPVQAAQLLEQAIDAANSIESRLASGVALVSLASLRGRVGDTGRALELFDRAVDHWRRIGDHTHQLTTLRNLVELLTRVGADEPAAVLHGAVTGGATPTFGAEADRLRHAWAELEGRLGPARAAAAADRGRQLAPAEMVDEAAAQLHALLAARTSTALGPPARPGEA